MSDTPYVTGNAQHDLDESKEELEDGPEDRCEDQQGSKGCSLWVIWFLEILDF
jgi:hypothetical protein